MKKISLILISIITFLSIIGCSKIDEMNEILLQGKELVYTINIDGEEIKAFKTDNSGDENLSFFVNGKWIGDDYELCGYKKSDNYYYFDDISKLDIYNNGVIVEPIEVIEWETSKTSVYKLNNDTDYTAYPRGTTNFNDPIQTNIILYDGSQTTSIEHPININDFNKFLNKCETYIPESGRVAIDTGDEYSHKISVVEGSLIFNKELIGFYTVEIFYSLSTSEPFYGILEELIFSFGVEDRYNYYKLNMNEVDEFDLITGYSKVISEQN